MNKEENCVHCRKPKSNHQAGTLSCPIGKRTAIGYIGYHRSLVFTSRVRANLNKHLGKLMSAIISMGHYDSVIVMHNTPKGFWATIEKLPPYCKYAKITVWADGHFYFTESLYSDKNDFEGTTKSSITTIIDNLIG